MENKEIYEKTEICEPFPYWAEVILKLKEEAEQRRSQKQNVKLQQ